MKRFKVQNKIFGEKNDEFYNEINNLIGFDQTTICGSYIKYGKDKACDLDLTENINYLDFDVYLNKIFNNRKQYYTIEIYLDKPYKKLEIIKNKLGYITGNFEKIQKDSIIDDVNNLPEILKNDLLELIKIYSNSRDINDFIKIKLYVNKHIYPRWTYKELLLKNKIYYDENIILNNNFTYIYIEVIFKKIRVSNFLTFKIDNEIKNYVQFNIEDLVFNNNIFYYKLLKKFLVFIKWLFATKRIKDQLLNDSIIDLYNDIYDFIDNIGNKYNKNCINNNYINIYIYKINKYNYKNNKNNNKLYLKLINKYNKKLHKKEIKYNEKMNKINESAKEKYLSIFSKYNFKEYLDKNYKII